MKEINIGGKNLRVRATPLALLYYRQEFKTDLVGDLAKMDGIEKDISRFDSVTFLQITWAMNRADAGAGTSFPDFNTWLSGFKYFDFSDPLAIQAVLEEAINGFFRGQKLKEKTGEKSRAARTL